jgi:hypothetical protein
MQKNIVTILVIVIIFILIIYLTRKSIESFTTYSYDPYNYMDTGADPLTFYRYPIYRQPYMFPYKFYSSYPYPYMTYYPTNI